MRFDLSQLKRLVKSRAGRIAELQMEIKIIEGIIESKIKHGDLGSPKETAPKKEEPKKEPESHEEPKEEKKELTKDIKPSSTHSFEEME